MHDPVYSLSLEASALVALWLGLAACQGDRSAPGREWFAGLALSTAVWCVAELLADAGVLGPWNSLVLAHVGAMTLPACWLGCAAHACRLDLARRLPWFPAALLAPQVLIFSTLALGPWGSIFLGLGSDGEIVRGPLWWLHATYSYTLIGTGTTVFLIAARRWRRRGEWARRAWIGAGSLVPLIGSVLYIRSGFSWEHDWTPVLLGVSALCIRSAFFHHDILTVYPLSTQELIEGLPVGLVLSDPHGTVVDVNPKAARLLGILPSHALGRELDAVLEAAPPGVEHRLAVLGDGSRRSRVALIESARIDDEPEFKES